MPPAPQKIWMPLRAVVGFAAVINLIVGLIFIIGPEFAFTLWPSPVGSTISRFIGAIIFANGVGSALVTWNGTWENARVLFAVALTYGLIVLVALPFDMILYKKDTILWGYVAIDAVFLFPIGLIFLWNEYTRWKQRRAK